MTDTSNVDRYAVSENRSGLGYSNGLVPALDGGFVSFDDYTALRTKLTEAKAKVERLRDVLQKVVDLDREATNDASASDNLEDCAKLARQALKGSSND